MMDRRTERALLLLGLLAAGCGGGGGGEDGVDVLGLEGPSTVSIVTASSSESTPGALLPGAVEDFASDADYNLDASNAYVYDPSMETLSMVNQILCMVSQTAYGEMVNQGEYNAQVDESLCASGADGGSTSSTGQSSGAGAEAPEIWVVNSERADNDSAQVVSFWVPQEGDEFQEAATIRVSMTIEEGVSTENPFGVFSLDFAGVPDVGGDVDDPIFFGTLESLDVLDGFLGFSFYQEEGDVTVAPASFGFAQTTSANVNMFTDQTEGVARISKQERSNFPPGGDTGILETEYLLAFNETHVLREVVGGNTDCLSRTEFDSNVWRYNLYYADGENAGMRVERNGGFGFKTADGAYGWMGYYGMWLPDGVTLENGDIVLKDVFGQEPVEYSVVQAPGKLIEHSRDTLLLGEAVGMQFEYWQFQEPMEFGEPMPPSRLLVEYDGESFAAVAEWDDESQSWEYFEFSEALDVESLGALNMYSESLGGSVTYVFGSDSLTYFTSEFVNPANALFANDTTIDLYGYVQCLGAEITAEDAEVGNVYLDDSMDVGSPHHFVFDAGDMTLYWDSDGEGTLIEVGLADGEEPSSGPFTWGMHSGSLLLDVSGLESVYDVFSQETFYSYETGHNAWNQYAVLLDENGDAVSFDPPIQFTYTHSTENDRNGDSAFDGQKFLLNYGGPGDLGGIPSEGVDLDEDGLPDRWYPILNIADGVVMGPEGTEYVIKAIELEQRLSAAPGECGSLTTGPVLALPLPDGADFVTPDIGAKPVVTDAPAVIAGTVQSAD